MIKRVARKHSRGFFFEADLNLLILYLYGYKLQKKDGVTILSKLMSLGPACILPFKAVKLNLN